MLDILSYKAWALEERFFNMAAMRVMRAYIEGTSLDDLVKHTRAKSTERLAAQHYQGVQAQRISDFNPALIAKSKSGVKVGIVPVVGTLTKRGDACSYGMRDYQSWTEQLKEMGAQGMLYDMEGPGGTVDGTPEFGENTKNSSIPILTFADGMIASANYWVASQSAHIMANKLNPTEFGSIGVLQMHENWSKFIEEKIGSIEILRATQSKDKARINVIEELRKEDRTQIQQELDQWADIFKATVQSGRGSALQAADEDIFTGKMYREDVALKYGMIDSIGTFAEAIEKAAQLGADARHPVSVQIPPSKGGGSELASEPGGSITTQQEISNPKSNYMFSKIFGDSSESAQKLTADEKTALASAEEKLIKVEAENALLKQQLQDATELSGELKADAKTKDAKIAELEAKLAATPAVEKPATTEQEDPKPAEASEPKLNYTEA